MDDGQNALDRLIEKAERLLKSDRVEASGGEMCPHILPTSILVVDDDINLSNPEDVLWALTTRFQVDKKLQTYPESLGSSLDQSSKPGEDRRSRRTFKAGFDCTIPLSKNRKDFEKVH